MTEVMVPLKKKSNATKCSDHRTISLVVHASKILLKILTKRIESKVAAINYIGEDQYGFRKEEGPEMPSQCSDVWEKEVWNMVKIYISVL